MDLDTLADQIAALYDGPHTADTVIGAARATHELARYLANATHNPAVLPYAPNVDRVIGHLRAATSSLEQILGQLSAAVERQSHDEALYDDRRDRFGRDTAHDLIAALNRSRYAAGDLTHRLGQARSASTHLGHD